MHLLPDVATASASDLLSRSLKIALVLVLAFVATRLLRRSIARFVAGLRGERFRSGVFRVRERAPNALLRTSTHQSLRAAQRAETIGALLRSIATFTIWAIAVLTVFGEVGINLAPLIAGAGIVGVAVGFGAQNLVRDFLSGIFMLLEDQYGVGDTIDLGPATGVVEGVGLRTTRIRDIQGNVWHVPNGNIERIANKSQQWARAIVDVDVDGDVGQAVQVMSDAAVALSHELEWSDQILEEPEVLGVETLGPHGATIRLAVKTIPNSQWRVARELRARIKVGLDAAEHVSGSRAAPCGMPIPNTPPPPPAAPR